MSKRIICIDETGKFESREEKAKFLGGCTFTGERIGQEEANLERMFQSLCENISKKFAAEFPAGTRMVYPYSFHMSALKLYDQNNKEIILNQKEFLAKVKNEILKQVKNYLIEHKNQYRLFAFIDPKQNTGSHEESEATKDIRIVDFHNPGVLYERLITLLVYNFTFYSFNDDVEKNIFKIASRTPTVLAAELSEEQRQAIQNLNDVWVDGNNKMHLTATNINTFKSALAVKYFEGNAINKRAVNDIELECKSLNYTANNSKVISPFYYLADIICYYIQRYLYQKVGYDEFFINSDILKKVGKDMPVSIDFWVYDEVDSLFKKMMEAYEEGRLAECFAYRYDIEHSASEFGSYYMSTWVQRFDRRVLSDYTNKLDNKSEAEKRMLAAKRKSFKQNMDGYIADAEIYMRSEALYGKGKYIVERLMQIVAQGNYDLTKRQAYLINDFSLRYYNHQGSIEKSRKYFRRLVELKDAVNIEEFESSLNRAAQIYFNQFDYGPLVDIYEILLQDAENIKKAYQAQMASINEIVGEYFSDVDSSEMTGVNDSRSGLEWLGKMYSSLGQAYAFSEQYADAEQRFRKAMDEFNTEANRLRTLGYLLHVYIASGQMDDYLRESPVYFQSDNPREQILKLIEGDICGFARYNLFVWIKAVYVFELYKTVSYKEAICTLLKHIKETYQAKADSFFEHPWALISKYLYWVCKETRAFREYEDFFKKLCFEPAEQDEETVKVIKLFNKYQVEETDEINVAVGAAAYDSEALKEKITYMYI